MRQERKNNFLLLSKKVNHTESGNSMVEFAIILPLLVFLILGTVEYTKLFKFKEFQTTITREAGTIAYRYCFERTTRNCETDDLLGEIGLHTNTNFEACLAEWRNAINTSIQQVLEGTELTVSFYQIENPVAGSPINLLAATSKDAAGNAATKSHYINSVTNRREDFEPMLISNEIIVVAESFVTFDSTLAGIFGGFANFGDGGRMELYHVSAY